MAAKAMIALALAGFIGPLAQAQRLPDGFFPESLAMAKDGSLFAGSATLSSIVRVAPGAVMAVPFVPAGSGGMMSVQGLLVDDASGRLFACSADLGVAKTAKTSSALLAFDLADGRLRGRWTLPGGGFCNDIARGPDRHLYISDTASSRVLKFDVTSSRLSVWTSHPALGGAQFNGNGIAFDGRNLYLSTFSDGRLVRVPMQKNGRAGTPLALALPRPLAGADALRTIAPGRLLAFENDIAGGNGRLTLIDIADGEPRLSTFAEGLAEPVSGVTGKDKVIVLESQFRKLFGAQKGVAPAPFALRTIALPKPAAALTSITLPDGAAYPNGIAATPDGSLYIGLITDGKILKRDTAGQWSTLTPGSPEVFAATSLRLDPARQLLWGTSPDFLPQGRPPRPHRVFSIDLATGTIRDSLPLPGAGFGNDIALTEDGDVLLTDSAGGRVLRIAAGTQTFTTLLESALLEPNEGGRIGAAGIARAPDGRLVIGNFGSGKLILHDSGGTRELLLPRRIDNPDGMAFAPDGALIVLEGALTSGEGKVLRIAHPFAAGQRAVEVLADGLDSPVNLTITPSGTLYLTESRIRHRMNGGKAPEPGSFRVLVMETARAL